MYAQFEVADFYENGIFVTQDDDKAFEWYLKSATQGYSDAEYAVGILYIEGLGVEKNEDTGIEWIKRAAFHGNYDAENYVQQYNRIGH